jgi:hypothetical protein
VADVHTDVPNDTPPDPGSVLHEAVGGVNLLMIAVDNGADRFVCAGPVLSHYEFEVTGAPRRISDEEWRGTGFYPGNGIINGHFPADISASRIEGLAPPVWTRNYLVSRPALANKNDPLESNSADSDHIHRINIHSQSDVFRQLQGLDHCGQFAAQGTHLAAAQHHLVTVKSFRAQQRGWRRSRHDKILETRQFPIEFLFQMGTGKFHLVLIASLERKQRNAADRRVAQLFAKFQFLIVKPREIMSPRKLNRGMERRERLHDDLPFDVSPASPTRHLGQQLKGALSGSEIRLVQGPCPRK